MESAEVGTHEEIRPDVIRHFSQMAYFSFELSQGSETLQKDIVLYAKAANPELIISENELKEVYRELANKVMNRFNLDWQGQGSTDATHPWVEESAIGQSIRKIMDVFELIFLDDTEPTKEDLDGLEEKILEQIIERDYQYLVMRGGRQRGREAGDSERYNPMLSHLRYFVGEGHKLPVPEFNEMLSRLRDRFSEKLNSGEIIVNENQELREIDRKYFPGHLDLAVSVLAKTWESANQGKFLEPFSS